MATSKEICAICDQIEDCVRGKNVSRESIADDIIAAYKRAGEIGIRGKYASAEEISIDRKLILEDLEDRPRYVLGTMEDLGADMFDYERLQEVKA